MSRNHLRFLAKTVLVRNNDIEPAYRVLDRILRSENFFTDVKRKERYEKPCQQRRRVSYERCRRIYNSEMQRKIEFVMRKNRTNPFPR
ncbi:28S ribosomal protein S21, mitochondrial-like [Pomacea canaliculata]|uniref:28S ribosomal protein S21, mitochondrial-like n=1 Tax=Pomacea canaliculata TaxID=400727 RepID=UPI000D73E5A3|nr:28S ribosomal protein S21, mitochondrial-like [Pomacea canaliculata]